MQPVRFLLFGLCAGLISSACSTLIPTKTPESWLTELPFEEFMDFTEQHIVPREDIYILPPSTQLEAEALLQRTSAVQLSQSKAEALMEKELPSRSDLALFLVRGVSQNQETGSFECMFFRRLLLVSYGAMGSQSLPMKRQPIIVRLPERPKKIFVTCSVMD
jgi:hypothetical protein